ncbi:MAG: phosphoribosyltransferase [Bacteroidetes bacterium]|nr:MAG: phosphoribosyltransferase [Bacteroidota bacterium]
MTSQRTIVLTNEDIEIKIQRIAHEILENNYNENQLFFIGISKQGYLLAKLVKDYFTTISDISVSIHEMRLNKKNPLASPIEITPSIEGKNTVLILFDDVLNSGKTLAYGVKQLLEYPVKKLETVVMVNRRHRNFPIRADYVGLTLSTTLQDHITVILDKEKMAYLN